MPADPFTCDNELHRLDARIHSAWAALNGARAVANHSPSGDNCAIENLCERVLNELLEKRHEMTAVVRQ